MSKKENHIGATVIHSGIPASCASTVRKIMCLFLTIRLQFIFASTSVHGGQRAQTQKLIFIFLVYFLEDHFNKVGIELYTNLRSEWYTNKHTHISYLCEGRYVWIIGACSRGSSTSPTRTGVCTPVFLSVRPFAHCRHMSEKPWERNKWNVSWKKHIFIFQN